MESAPSMTPGRIASYHLIAPSPAAGTIVMIERMDSDGATAAQLAQSLADRVHATVAPGSFQVGGEKAVKITAAIQVDTFSSRDTYVVVHGAQAYLFSGLSTAAVSAKPVLDALIGTVSFAPPESPTKHLGVFLDEPFGVWGFKMNGPACLRRVEASDTDVHLGIYDFSGKEMTNPLNLDFQHLVINTPKTFADIRDAYSAGLQKQLGLADALVWHEQPGVPGLFVSNPVNTVLRTEKGEQVKMNQRYCFFQAAPGDFTQILFSLSEMPEADLRAYLATEDQMIASIKPEGGNPAKP